mmetsp:Transcript_28011/g.68084  ORF Transcript_28011/g.68084 Transcript_28011/m.68084 type:complete len:864 (+) Transcript_28011:79-2670(+)
MTLFPLLLVQVLVIPLQPPMTRSRATTSFRERGGIPNALLRRRIAKLRLRGGRSRRRDFGLSLSSDDSWVPKQTDTEEIFQDYEDPKEPPVDKTISERFHTKVADKILDSLSDDVYGVTEADLAAAQYLTNDKGVLKIVKQRGLENRAHPKKGDAAVIQFRGMLEDGTPFRQTRRRIRREDTFRRFTVPLGTNSEKVVRGLEIGILSMNEGEIAHLTLEPAYAYGDMGNVSLGVPAQTRLVFVVELLKIIPLEKIKGFDGLRKQVLQEGFQIPFRPLNYDECLLSYRGRIGSKTVCLGEKILYPLSEAPAYRRNHITGEYVQIQKEDQPFAIGAIHETLKTMQPGETCRVWAESGFVPTNKPLLGSPKVNQNTTEHRKINFTMELDIILHHVYPIRVVHPNVYFRQLREPHTLEGPSTESRVEIEYAVKTSGGRTIVRKHRRENYTVGGFEDGIPDHVDTVIETMQIGQEAEVFGAASEFKDVYGNLSYPDIPEHETVRHYLRLLSFTQKVASESLSSKEKLQEAVRLKDLGNKYFNFGNSYKAKQKYGEALDLLMYLQPIPLKYLNGYGLTIEEFNSTFFGPLKDVESGIPLPLEQQRLFWKCRAQLYLNLAAVDLKMKNFEEAETWCSRALFINPRDAKALYRLGKAKLRQKNPEAALQYFRRAKNLVGEDIELDRIISKLSSFGSNVQEQGSHFPGEDMRKDNVMLERLVSPRERQLDAGWPVPQLAVHKSRVAAKKNENLRLGGQSRQDPNALRRLENRPPRSPAEALQQFDLPLGLSDINEGFHCKDAPVQMDSPGSKVQDLQEHSTSRRVEEKASVYTPLDEVLNPESDRSNLLSAKSMNNEFTLLNMEAADSYRPG